MKLHMSDFPSGIVNLSKLGELLGSRENVWRAYWNGTLDADVRQELDAGLYGQLSVRMMAEMLSALRQEILDQLSTTGQLEYDLYNNGKKE